MCCHGKEGTKPVVGAGPGGGHGVPPGLVDPELGDVLGGHVLLVLGRVPLPQHAHRRARLQRAAHHAPKRVERRRVRLGVLLRHGHHQRTPCVARAHRLGQRTRLRARVRVRHLHAPTARSSIRVRPGPACCTDATGTALSALAAALSGMETSVTTRGQREGEGP